VCVCVCVCVWNIWQCDIKLADKLLTLPLYPDIDLCFRLLDLVPRRLDFIALSFTIRVVEALGASAATTAAFAITAAVFPHSVATTFVSTFTDLHTEGSGPPGASSGPGGKRFWAPQQWRVGRKSIQ
jgi:hypothetical protein